MKLIIYDDEANKQRSTNLYSRLIEQDDVHFLLGPYSSSITYTVGSTIERQGVPMVAAGAASPAVYNEVRDKWIHSVLSTVDKYNLGLIDAAARAPGDPVVRGIRENNEVNQISAKATEEYAKQNGVDYKTVDTYEEQTNDLSSSISKAASQNADMIMNLGHQKTDQLLVDGVHSLGVELEAVGVGVAVAVKSFHEAMGVEKAQYVYGPQLWSPRIDAPNIDQFTEDFAAWYKEITGSTAQPDYHGGLAGVAIQVVKQTIEETGNLEREALRKTMANHEYTGTLNGDFTFGDNGVYQPQRSYGVQLQGEDLAPEIVAPEEFASAEPIWPAPNMPGQS